MNTENGSHEPDDSEVFLVRLWTGEVESLEGSEIKVQGKVTHLLSGKGSTFNGGAALMSLLVDMLPATRSDHNLEEEKGA
jgi:hypothetical protein